MATLIQTLAGGLEYSGNWAIYAEPIDGEFKPESLARFGQTQFENGGVLDDCEFFATNERAIDAMSEWNGSFSEWFTDGLMSAELWSEWIKAFEEGDGTEEENVEWGGNRSEVLNWVVDNREDLYQLGYNEWQETINVEESALQLIDEVNESLKIAA